MRTPIRLQLTLNYLVVLFTGMGLAAALAWFSVEGLYLETQRENLLAQARITAAALQGAPLPLEPAEPYAQTSNVQPGIHTRVLGEQGAVIVGLPLPPGNTPVQAPPAENSGFTSPEELLQRPEIQKALRGEATTAIRTVAAAGNRRVLYAAAPILAADNSLAGIVYLASPLPPAGLPLNLLLELAGAILVAVLLAGGAGTFLARRIARPIEAVARAANSVAAGDLDQRVPDESSIRELNSLGQSFNAMTASLAQADQAKNAFIADITHELRTPLTVIKGTIETLEDGALDDTAGRGPLLASMERETGRLIRLVNDLLVLARADAGALRLNIQPLDLGELARSRCEHLALLAASRQVELFVAVDDSASRSGANALGDTDRLAQVLDNLLDNAIRHSPQGSTVTVSIQRVENELQCLVSDRGPGIPAEHLPLIFERFYRAEASRDRHTGGAGLGLAIARALVLAQGGRITAQSAEAEGTVITFWLPCAGTAIQLPEN